MSNKVKIKAIKRLFSNNAKSNKSESHINLLKSKMSSKDHAKNVEFLSDVCEYCDAMHQTTPFRHLLRAMKGEGALVYNNDGEGSRCYKMFFPGIGETFVREFPINAKESRPVIASIKHPKWGVLNVVSFSVKRDGEDGVVDFEYFSSKGIRYEERTHIYNEFNDTEAKSVFLLEVEIYKKLTKMPKSCAEDYFCITDLSIITRIPQSSNETKACDK